jgi:hypothetical protein
VTIPLAASHLVNAGGRGFSRAEKFAKIRGL